MSHLSARPRPQPAPERTLWEEGRLPGGQVAAVALVAVLSTAALNLALTGRLSLFFDLTFVVVCLVTAFAVRPRDFFVAGVLPPLLMLATVVSLAVLARGAVAEAVDSLTQAVVSGLAHHAGGLVAGYASALIVLALRQVGPRHAGAHQVGPRRVGSHRVRRR
ncbi:DUF6542 domain-containing protein [Nocardioides pakistanensis]